jgi:hypothetical protein
VLSIGCGVLHFSANFLEKICCNSSASAAIWRPYGVHVVIFGHPLAPFGCPLGRLGCPLAVDLVTVAHFWHSQIRPNPPKLSQTAVFDDNQTVWHSQTLPNPSQLSRNLPNPFKPPQTFPTPTKYVFLVTATHFWHSQTLPNLPKPFQTLPNPPKPFQNLPHPPVSSQTLRNIPKPSQTLTSSSSSLLPPHLLVSKFVRPIHECIFRSRYSMDMWCLDGIGRDIWVWVFQKSLYVKAFPRVG